MSSTFTGLVHEIDTRHNGIRSEEWRSEYMYLYMALHPTYNWYVVINCHDLEERN